MDISENKLPALKSKKGYPDIDTFKRIIRLIQIRDIPFYEELKEFFQNRNNTHDLITLLMFGQNKNFRICKR